jgi:hypothetical protein
LDTLEWGFKKGGQLVMPFTASQGSGVFFKCPIKLSPFPPSFAATAATTKVNLRLAATSKKEEKELEGCMV